MEQTEDKTQPEKEDVLPDNSKATTRIVAFDYLRVFAIILVLLHHAVLAYATFGFINFENPIETFSPVVDSQKWVGFDLIALFNDIYFMALLFFISGLFVWRSLTRKGVRTFLRDRLIRLGIPFVICVPLLIPLAYYPAQLEVGLITGVSSNYFDFWLDMVRSGFPTAGPLWFIWMLLAFNVLIAVLYRIFSHSDDTKKNRVSALFKRPVVFFGALLGISTVAYLPMVLTFGQGRWIGIGPIDFQASRILVYLVYFLAGTAVGAYGLDRTIFKSKSKLARRWWVWLAAGVVLFIVWIINLGAGSPEIILTFTVPCAVTVFALIAIFLRFTNHGGGYHPQSEQ